MEEIKPLQSSDFKEIKEKFFPFILEVRKRIIITISVFAIACVIGFVFYEKILRVLVSVLSLEGINIVFTSPFQFINLAFSCGLATGVVVVFPVLVAQILFFLKPALREKEYKLITKFLPLIFILFLLGFAFGAVIMRWQIEIFLARSESLGIGNILDISGLLTTVFLTSALMGLGFQFPLVMLLLLRIGVIKQNQLSKKRKWVYLGSFIFTLFLPPDSILADILLSLPFIILFEMTLFLNMILERRRKN